MRRKGLRLGVTVVVWLALAPCAAAREVVEHHADGTPYRQYAVDEAGRRHGRFVEFHPNGAVAVRARYRNGVLNGIEASFHDSGRKARRAVYRGGRLTGTYEEWSREEQRTYVARFRDGLRHGKAKAWREGAEIAEQVWSEGALVEQEGVRVFSRTRASIEQTLAEILRPQREAVGPVEGWSAAVALARLKAYRYVCGVPWEDLVLDETCTGYALAASRICAALGQNTHEPPNPGWPADEYDRARLGAGECNLHSTSRAHGSIDSYMDDSDPRNIQHVGHRCWSLNPAMRKTGFGDTLAPDGVWYSAMWATDASRGTVPRVDAVCYPARGWMPIALFGPRRAWSAQIDPRDHGPVDPDRVEVQVFRLDERFLPEPEPLELDHLGAKLDGHGLPICIIFRPAALELSDGATYWVEIAGLDAEPGSRKDEPLRYLVRFFGAAGRPAR